MIVCDSSRLNKVKPSLKFKLIIPKYEYRTEPGIHLIWWSRTRFDSKRVKTLKKLLQCFADFIIQFDLTFRRTLWNSLHQVIVSTSEQSLKTRSRFKEPFRYLLGFQHLVLEDVRDAVPDHLQAPRAIGQHAAVTIDHVPCGAGEGRSDGRPFVTQSNRWDPH